MTEKPRSLKQQAHARTIAQRAYAQAVPKIVIASPPESLPRESWWLGASRDQFSAKAREHSERIRNSRFAQVNDPTYRSD